MEEREKRLEYLIGQLHNQARIHQEYQMYLNQLIRLSSQGRMDLLTHIIPQTNPAYFHQQHPHPPQQMVEEVQPLLQPQQMVEEVQPQHPPQQMVEEQIQPQHPPQLEMDPVVVEEIMEMEKQMDKMEMGIVMEMDKMEVEVMETVEVMEMDKMEVEVTEVTEIENPMKIMVKSEGHLVGLTYGQLEIQF
jgi:type IV secretory pathway VirB10-like protein